MPVKLNLFNNWTKIQIWRGFFLTVGCPQDFDLLICTVSLEEGDLTATFPSSLKDITPVFRILLKSFHIIKELKKNLKNMVLNARIKLFCIPSDLTAKKHRAKYTTQSIQNTSLVNIIPHHIKNYNALIIIHYKNLGSSKV